MFPAQETLATFAFTRLRRNGPYDIEAFPPGMLTELHSKDPYHVSDQKSGTSEGTNPDIPQ